MSAADPLARLFVGAGERFVRRGEVLVRDGDRATELYRVVSGRFHVVEGGVAVAEIGRGETIGELAFFAGDRRSATVVAARDAEVLVLDAKAYATRVTAEPGLLQALLGVVAERLIATTDRAPALARRSPRTVTLAPAGPSPSPRAVFRRLAAALGPLTRLGALVPEYAPGGLVAEDDEGRRLARFLDAQERRHDLLLFLAEPGRPGWNAAVLSQSDALLLVGEGEAGPLNEIERAAATLLPAEDVSLLLLSRGGRPAAASPWLEGRTVGLAHQLGPGEEGCRRLARFLTGRAAGLVLGGGGAQGAAHVGVYRALREAGVPIDIAGGTSIGAAMAVPIAMGLDPDEILDRLEAIFVEGRAMRRYTLPFYSLLDHTHFDAALRAQFKGLRLEDLAIPCFAVSASLTSNAAVVHRQGPAFDAVRASAAIPGVLPPYPLDGHLLVDGAIVDNVPVAAMRTLKDGPNVVVALAPEPAAALPDYAALPGRGALFGRLVASFGRAPSYPSLAATLVRSLLLNSRRTLSALDLSGDLLVSPPLLPGMGLFEWEKARAQERLAYEHMARLIEGGAAELFGRAD